MSRDRDLGEAHRGIEDALGDIAGAARHVEDAIGQRCSVLGGASLATMSVLPQPVHAAAHQIVHEVIAVGHVVEHLVDQRLLLFERHRPFPEMRGLSHPLSAFIVWRVSI